ncbi:MAG: hypothetical protein ACWGQW_04790 [bacterium]
MSLKSAIENKAFAGRYGSLGKVNIILKTTTGAPSGYTCPVGTLCWNSFDGDAYICTVASTTWVKINA